MQIYIGPEGAVRKATWDVSGRTGGPKSTASRADSSPSQIFKHAGDFKSCLWGAWGCDNWAVSSGCWQDTEPWTAYFSLYKAEVACIFPPFGGRNNNDVNLAEDWMPHLSQWAAALTPPWCNLPTISSSDGVSAKTISSEIINKGDFF